MKKKKLLSILFPGQTLKVCVSVLFILFSGQAIAQTFPAASSCTSGDLELLSATLPPPLNDRCNCSGTRTLVLGIRNKTGSTRTSFALWGTLHRYNSSGVEIGTGSAIFACAGPITKNSDNFLPATSGNISITVNCGETLTISDLYLAWTSASPGETCAVLQASPSTINPKCGTLPLIRVGIGVDALTQTTNATCSVGGKIKVTPAGGIPPYEVSIDAGNYVAVPANPGYYEFTNVAAGQHNISIRDNTGRPVGERCSTTKTPTVNSAAAVIANAGDDFTKSCIANASGAQIGEASSTDFTYSWSPTDGLSSSTSSNPTANPSSTQTYTVTKTNTATGCSNTDQVTVTVNKPTVTANAGDDFTKPCTDNSSGKQIGESSAAGFTYSWSPTDGLSSSTSSNPTANPTSTKVYTVTKTHTSSGCSATDQVTVTVNAGLPTFTVCIVQPTLCNNGSLTITPSNGSGYTFSIKNDNFVNNGGVFNDLKPGDVGTVKVSSANGCVSVGIACADLVSNCSGSGRAAPSTFNTESRTQETTVKAYPNPFSDRVKFMVTSTVAGNGNLEVYNMMGQKVKTVYQGYIAKGTQTFELSLPKQNVGNLVYVLRIGDKKMTGKILQLNQ